MLLNILSGLLLVAIPSLIGFAFKYPDSYKRLWRIVLPALAATFLVLTLWDVFLYCAQYKLMQSIAYGQGKAAVDSLAEIEVPFLLMSIIFWVAMAFLAVLTKVAKLRTGKDGPPPETIP